MPASDRSVATSGRRPIASLNQTMGELGGRCPLFFILARFQICPTDCSDFAFTVQRYIPPARPRLDVISGSRTTRSHLDPAALSPGPSSDDPNPIDCSISPAQSPASSCKPLKVVPLVCDPFRPETPFAPSPERSMRSPTRAWPLPPWADYWWVPCTRSLRIGEAQRPSLQNNSPLVAASSRAP